IRKGRAAWARPSSSRKKRGLALRELEGTASLGPAVLLALDHARVAGQEAAALERAAQFRLEVGKRLGQAVAPRARLPSAPPLPPPCASRPPSPPPAAPLPCPLYSLLPVPPAPNGLYYIVC